MGSAVSPGDAVDGVAALGAGPVRPDLPDALEDIDDDALPGETGEEAAHSVRGPARGLDDGRAAGALGAARHGQDLRLLGAGAWRPHGAGGGRSRATGGHDRHSVCRQHHEFSIKALEGSVPPEAADSWFAYIATLDPGDDRTDPTVWIKANPSLGVTVKVEDLRRQIDEAREMPAQQNAIRRLRLNEWTEQVTRWLDMTVWSDGGPPPDADWQDVKADLDDLEERLAGRPCYGGLDLARVNDLSAFVLLFPPGEDAPLRGIGDRWVVLARFWVPEEDILRRARRDRVPYDVWRDQGFLTATQGNATDFAFIEQEILDLAGRFDIQEIGYDRTFAGEIVANLQDGNLQLVQFGQGFLSLAAPTAELERLVISRSLWHGGHPVLRWNAANVAVRQDPAGNLKPDKERSRERIDGISALVNALGRALLPKSNGRSAYETQEILII